MSNKTSESSPGFSKIESFLRDGISQSWYNLSLPLTDWQKQELERESDSILAVRCFLKSWFVEQPKLSPGVYCNATWDGHSCWPYTPSGSTLVRKCSDAFAESQPKYAPHLEGEAYRVCSKNGSWLWNEWTNYSECADSYEAYVANTQEEQELVTQVRYILFFGSILSIFSLVLAIAIFSSFRSLWCDRVTIHLHLMGSLILRYILLYIITEAFVFDRETNYRSVDWVCKSVLLVYLYSTVTSVNWMFIQGIYLNGKLTTNVFDKAAPFKLYYAFGWLSPIPLMMLYAAVMESHHPAKCWKGYSEMTEIWIVLAPMLTALVVNLLLLLNILRILVTKVHRTGPNPDSDQLRRAAKATLILSPILGVSNLVFLYNPGGDYNKYYVLLNTLFGSTQGFFVAVIYCYMSNDVRSAFRRCYRRLVARREASRLMERRRQANSSSSSTGPLIVERPLNFLRRKSTQRIDNQFSFLSFQNLTVISNPQGNRLRLQRRSSLSVISNEGDIDGLRSSRNSDSLAMTEFRSNCRVSGSRRWENELVTSWYENRLPSSTERTTTEQVFVPLSELV